MGRVREWLADRARSVAPRTIRNLESISRMNSEYEVHGPRVIVYERELRELRREIDALRRENRRVVELYDAVFDYVRSGSASHLEAAAPSSSQPKPSSSQAAPSSSQPGPPSSQPEPSPAATADVDPTA